jgi:hypothetical protein
MNSMGLLRCILSGFVVMMLLPCAYTQQTKPPGGSSGTGGSKGDTTRPPVTQQPAENPRPQRMNPQMLFISGMVVQEDGNPLPSGVVIERVCGGHTKKEAYVSSSSGSFAFQIGGGNNTSNVLPDASDENMSGFDTFGSGSGRMSSSSASMDPMSSGNLMGCELRAQLPGYRSSTVTLTGFSLIGPVDVGTIIVQPISKVPGTTVSVNDMQAPKDAKKAKERAAKAMQRKKPEEAEKELRAAIEIYPDYASAWYQLGLVYQSSNRNKDARDAYQKAISIDSKYVGPYIQLARLAGTEQKWQEVAEITDQALALDPLDFPEGYFFNAMAYYVMNKFDVAERSARKAQRLDSLHRIPRINIILADILQKKQDLAGSIEQLQAYLNFTPTPADSDSVRSRIQKLEQLSKSLASNPTPSP